jgi:glutamate/aspartate transport system substrate-binding protein
MGGSLMLRAASILIALLLGAGLDADRASAQEIPNDRLETIKASKVIKIAHRTDASPFAFFSPEHRSEPVGYTIDICKHVVASLERQIGIQDIKIEWVAVATQDRFKAVASGVADLECGSSTVTLERMKLVDFSNYVFVESTGVVVRADVVRDLTDLVGKKIAVVAGTTNERAIALQNRQRQLKAIIVPVENREAAVAALDSGQVEAIASDKTLLVATQFKSDQKLRLLPQDLSIEPYAIVLPRGDWKLRLAVNTALAEIFRSGEIRKIFNRWFLQIGLQPGILLNSAFILGAVPE